MTKSVNILESARDRLKVNLSQKQDAAHVNRVLATPEVTLEDMEWLSSEEKVQFLAALEAEKKAIGDDIHGQLRALLQEAGSPSVPAQPVTTPAWTQRDWGDKKNEVLKWVVPRFFLLSL